MPQVGRSALVCFKQLRTLSQYSACLTVLSEETAAVKYYSQLGFKYRPNKAAQRLILSFIEHVHNKAVLDPYPAKVKKIDSFCVAST